MIKLIQRKDLNIKLYSTCLRQADNYLIYAEYWYLDALMGNNWDCYVLDNYQAIMPVPFLKKFTFKIITQPIYCQQLGIFSLHSLTKEKVKLFTNKLKWRIVKGYHFNENNLDQIPLKFEQNLNQILYLPSNYTDYLRTIRKNRKQEIKKGLPLEYTIEAKQDDLQFISHLQANYTSIESELFLEKLKPLAREIINRRKGITVNLSKGNELVASSFYIISNNRLIQLCNAKKDGLAFNANTYIIDYIIKTYNTQYEILDFEGSTLKGIHDFNSSFRAETIYYPKYQTKVF